MVTGLLLILLGILSIFIPKTKWYLKVTSYNESCEGEEFLAYFRIIVGLLFIFLGILDLYSFLF